MRKMSGLHLTRYTSSKQKQRKKQVASVLSVGLCVLLIGIPLLETKYGRGLAQRTIACFLQQKNRQTTGYKSNKTVFSLALTPPAVRAAELEAIANGENSRESFRARYLLASDLLEKQQAQKAVDLLDGLECDYGLLAANITHKRAQAYQMLGDQTKATTQWENLLKYYPDSPLVPDALFVLGRKNRQDWKDTIAKYPGHPRTLQMARLWLKQDPNQRDLLLLLAKNAFDTPRISEVLDKLLGLPSTVDGKPVEPIKPEDWEAIAAGYWQERKYGQASAAYSKAAPTSHNAYLVARGLQLAEKETDANIAYKKMVHDFPKAKETGNALLQIAKIEPSIEAVPYLDQAINKFPDRAGEALLAKAKALEHLSNPQGAAQARQLLLEKYGNSDAAAEYRWEMAQTSAVAGDIPAALQWAQPILDRNPNSEQARQAGFWVGKWASKLGQQQQAKAAFEKVVAKYPQSYYAWRSATLLGWQVGDFTTLRPLASPIVQPGERSELPAGSATLKELYQLAQDQDAWTIWEAEFKNRLDPTVNEEFTDGVLKMGMGNYLEGIAQIYSLEDRDKPSEQTEFQSLKQKPIYWYALYPLPYWEVIDNWGQKRRINPLLVIAVMRQESRFMPNIRSSAGAVGLMQVMPQIASALAKEINLDKYTLDNADDNINLGTSLLASTHQLYQNNSLLALASYNAGAGNVAQWLEHKPLKDPDEFVETIPFIETRDYVKQVLGNYWNYLRLYNPRISQMVMQEVSDHK